MIQNSHGCHGYCKRNFAFLTAKGFFRVTEPVSFRDPPISKGGASQKDVRPSREVGTPAPFRYRPGLVSIRAKKKSGASLRCSASRFPGRVLLSRVATTQYHRRWRA